MHETTVLVYGKCIQNGLIQKGSKITFQKDMLKQTETKAERNGKDIGVMAFLKEQLNYGTVFFPDVYGRYPNKFNGIIIDKCDSTGRVLDNVTAAIFKTEEECDDFAKANHLTDTQVAEEEIILPPPVTETPVQEKDKVIVKKKKVTVLKPEIPEKAKTIMDEVIEQQIQQERKFAEYQNELKTARNLVTNFETMLWKKFNLCEKELYTSNFKMNNPQKMETLIKHIFEEGLGKIEDEETIKDIIAELVRIYGFHGNMNHLYQKPLHLRSVIHDRMNHQYFMYLETSGCIIFPERVTITELNELILRRLQKENDICDIEECCEEIYRMQRKQEYLKLKQEFEPET